jgi:Family of unknown function (DUF6001)
MTFTAPGSAGMTAAAPPVPGPAWLRRRRRNVTAFLAERGLDFAELTAFLTERAGPGRIMLTSSPVHGLANPSSDLDFIRIQAEPIEGARISTKIFDRGHHLEVTSYSAGEVARNLAELDRLAALPPGETAGWLRSWDGRLEPRRKQTERIVNGIIADGGMPYLGSIPALSVVWSRGSLHTALEQAVYLCLAEEAGECRGRVGYAVNTLLHLADALLSLSGDVYTTRKWYLLRWTRAQLARTAPDDGVRAVAGRLDALREEVTGALTGAELIAARYVDLCTRAAWVIAGTGDISVTASVPHRVGYHEFLPGAGLLLGPASSVVAAGPDVLDGLRTSLDGVREIGQRRAAGLLRAVRAGLARIDLTYPHLEAAI